MSPWPSFSAAIATWENRADQLCGKGAYQEILSDRDNGYRGEESVYVVALNGMLRYSKYNATISGFILCDSSPMKPEQAYNYVDNLPALLAKEAADGNRAELDRLGGGECSENAPKVLADNYFKRGIILVSLGEHKAAMACLMMAQEVEKDTLVYRDACTQISMMYELGWGVDKDIEMSKAWLKKAGL